MKSWLWGVGLVALALAGCGEGEGSHFRVPTELVDCPKNEQTRLYADPTNIEIVPDHSDPLWADAERIAQLTICNGGAKTLGILEIRRLEDGESGAGRLDTDLRDDLETPFSLPAGKGFTIMINGGAWYVGSGASYMLRFISDDSSLAPLEVHISY